MKPNLGIYLHIPFCRRKCLYCDFCSFPASTEELRAAYTDALCREVRSYRDAAHAYTVDTVYIGGGTPSCLSVTETERLLACLFENFDISENAEITSEVNPATADEEILRVWHTLGINRLSVGVQSFDDVELRALGRLHTAGEAEAFVAAARRAGFENIGLDLMYGIPGQTMASFSATLSRAVSLAPTHISAYSLQVEEGTPFFELRDTLDIPDDDANADLYDLCRTTLENAGYRQYEISNYARDGHFCRHNMRYWRMSPYIGMGVAAYSCFEGVRYGHDRDLAAYLASDFASRPVGETLTAAAREYESVMLGLRLSDGIDDRAFSSAFGYTFSEKYGARLAPYVAAGLAKQTGHGYALTPRGMYVSLAILAEILA